MKTIWVLENIQEDFGFYQRFNILNLVASVSLWRKWHPTDTALLYCDQITYDLIKYLEIEDLWDLIDTSILSREQTIDKRVFWAGSKLEILNSITGPVTIIDNDWLAFKNFDEERSKADVVYSHDENGIDYYLEDHEWYLTELKKTRIIKELFPTTQEAINVSFLTFNAPIVTKLYASSSVQLMEEWTEMQIKDNRLIIYAEQKLLKQLLRKYNVSHAPLIKDIWLCKEDGWGEEKNQIGSYAATETWDKFKHYGPDKRKYKDDLPGFEYEREVRFLYNCIGASKRVNVENLKEKIKIIQNV
jgi:hypothetical protein